MKNIEKTPTSFLFSYKLNPNKGTFPLFRERFKRKLGSPSSMSLAEAGAQAQQLVTDIDHLQVVSSRDLRNLPNSVKDLNKAVATWLWFVDHDPGESKLRRAKRTEDGFTALAEQDTLVEAVKDLYTTSEAPRLYTPLGDAMLHALEDGAVGGVFTDAVKVWAEDTDRGHLDANHKNIRDATRYVEAFTAVAGDKPLEQITRKDVARYIADRLQHVKTTAVQREINALRAVWNKAANHHDIQVRNPFANQPIKGLGTDAKKRPTPTLEEHRKLLAKLMQETGKGYSTPLLVVLALTGMRLAEAWGLMRSDWDKDGKTLHIRPNAVRPSLKTANSERPFPVLPELEPWLERLFAVKRAATPNAASASTAKKLGTITAHSLRHGFKQRLVEANATENVIKELLGWSDQGMMGHYGMNTVTELKRKVVADVYSQIAPTESIT